MGALFGAALAAIAGLVIAAATVIGIVQTVRENPPTTQTDTPVVQYGQR